ncbi:DNA polymerase III subunit gamma/tau [Sphingomonas sinipercae]|uniref:DNA polymerase III subunit gamma/tau n=1 Tax=Sphingomonas sinipercae TaxID=2714944 RepID=A0A6G7ZNB5_9SPHN|nr:DNA polymerase III subunit gamma/tau [Sphingomonas sinipercae]QIL02487.1 DNA polymerase III subunit gamma/tau [Sphingomonas sinipercae]
MTDESLGLGLDLPEAPKSAASPYRVLARKYRPQSFDQLIGQEAMVQTLANAIERGRVAHAFLLTGVRGVGKTSTARLIAKALNCIGPDGQGGPTIAPCGECENCRAIAEGRHIDVVEMDAASHTGVDDVREIIDAVRYASVSARYKIYIIDEVHMLSKNAFNALLKTLEEPPEHVKFLFATTEVNKVPVTVLSRTQRFDLRRIPAEKLIAHFKEVARLEGVEVEDDALTMIVRAAEGSARDGLSILDQAIAHGGGSVSAAQVREMLGLADRGRIRDLLQLILDGDTPGALAALDQAHDLGIDPLSLLRGLMEALHGASRSKAGANADVLLSAEQRQFAEVLAAKLSWAQIHRLWQMLLKGLADVTTAPEPSEAATMAVLRLIHSAEMPDPAAILDRLNGAAVTAGKPGAPSQASPSAPAAQLPADFRALVATLENNRKALLAQQMHDQVGLVRYAAPELVVKPLRPLGTDWPRDLAAALKAITGQTWTVSIADEAAEPSLLEQEKMAEERVRNDVLQDPAVRAAFDAFPEAELESYSNTRG